MESLCGFPPNPCGIISKNRRVMERLEREKTAMAEKKKSLCIICGLVEVEGTSICPNCSDSVRREAGGKHEKLKKEAIREFKKHGVTPDEAGQGKKH